MTLNQLSEKVLPTLLIAMIVACGSAYLELRELSVKITYLEKSVAAYHEEDQMRFKGSVTLNGVKPEVVTALIVCNDIYANYGQDMVVTSITEGTHGKGSLHYVGFAFDLRTRNFQYPKDIDLVVKDMREYLTEEFDIIIEKDHLHIEFQVKQPK